jgi:hypothetical protein
MHDKDISSWFHSYAGLRLPGVIAYFLLRCVLEKLKTGWPTCVSCPLIRKEEKPLEEILGWQEQG